MRGHHEWETHQQEEEIKRVRLDKRFATRFAALYKSRTT